MKDKIYSLIGFAIKAGKVIIGTDNILNKQKIYLVICCSSLAENSFNKIKQKTSKQNIVLLLYKDLLQDIVFKSGVKAIAITDKQLSEAIIKNLTPRFMVVGEDKSV